MVLRPPQPKDRWQAISVVTGVSLVEELIALGIEDAKLKWPNDALIEGKKIAGLLLEAESGQGCVVLGLGLNADFSGVKLPEDIKETATDLKSHLSKGQSLAEACARCVCAVFNGYRGSLPDLEVDSARADMLLWTFGEVEVLGQKGRVVGVGPRGELRLADAQDREFWVTCGEVQDALVH
jgi:biotin-(acetyl-CoA carboxylase) ligase